MDTEYSDAKSSSSHGVSWQNLTTPCCVQGSRQRHDSGSHDLQSENAVGDLSDLQCLKVSKGAKIRNQCNQVPHLTQDTNGIVTKLTVDTTNKSQEVSPFPAGDHKAHINRRVQRHSKHKTVQKYKRSTKEVPPWNGQ